MAETWTFFCLEDVLFAVVLPTVDKFFALDVGTTTQQLCPLRLRTVAEANREKLEVSIPQDRIDVQESLEDSKRP